MERNIDYQSVSDEFRRYMLEHPVVFTADDTHPGAAESERSEKD